MIERFMTRRAALRVLAGSVSVTVVGCGAAGPAVRTTIQVILKLPWDKITTVVVNILTGAVTIWGLLDGKEVKAEERLAKEQLEALEKGEKIKFELKDDKEQSVKPELKK